MRVTTLRAAGLAACVSVLALAGITPAQASTTITDPDGVDYDAACIASTATAAPPPNSVASPGTSSCAATAYDGSTDTTDIRSATLETTSTFGHSLKATIEVDGPIPAPNSPGLLDGVDGPAAAFNGYTYRLLFQNLDKQAGSDNPYGGCTTTEGGRWEDFHHDARFGYHYFLEYRVWWDGEHWSHRAAIGEYDPTIDGGYWSMMLGYNVHGTWKNWDATRAGKWSASVTGTGPSTITIETAAIVTRNDVSCVDDTYKWAAATPGDRLVNVKAVSSADVARRFAPVEVTTGDMCYSYGPCMGDTDSYGGYNFVSDVTEGSSTASGVGSNTITGVAYTPGAIGVTDSIGGFCSATHGVCQVPDDDLVGRGALFREYWETPYSLTA